MILQACPAYIFSLQVKNLPSLLQKFNRDIPLQREDGEDSDIAIFSDSEAQPLLFIN
jgi:hypothetical protein